MRGGDGGAQYAQGAGRARAHHLHLAARLYGVPARPHRHSGHHLKAVKVSVNQLFRIHI